VKTSLFEWAKNEGLSMEALGERLGLSWRHLYRVRSGEYPVTENFRARVVYRLGDWARRLFFGSVSEQSDGTAEEAAQ